MNPLGEPGRIGKVETSSRVVMAPMTTRLAGRDGEVTPQLIEYYRHRAKTGIGIITVEMASPEAAGRHRFHELGIYDDRYLPGLSQLASAIKSCGCTAAIQLGHGGGHTSARISGYPPVAPSAVSHAVLEIEFENVIPEAMTTERIRRTVKAFSEAAKRAYSAGFDIVEIHGAHGYLISQFLCPAENIREDEYGGSLENRARFALEIIREIKSGNPDEALVFRFDSDDFFPGGLTSAESIQVGIWAQEAGVDALHVTGGHYRSSPSAERMIPPMKYEQGCFVDHAAELKRHVSVPVIVVGRLGDPKLAARILAEGRADFVALGRPLLADPDWLPKALRNAPLRRCLGCNTCVNEMRSGAQLHCLVNPLACRETEWPNATRSRGKRIAVVGAGPAGLSYALLTAKDNDVTLFERKGRTGGAFNLAGLAPKFQEVDAQQNSFNCYIHDMTEAVEKAGVKVKLNTDPLTHQHLLEPFDEVVLAIGARYRGGIGWLVELMLKLGVSRAPGLRSFFSRPSFRNWFYYRARKSAAQQRAKSFRARGKVLIIGDAREPGKSTAAIESAYVAALGVPNANRHSPVGRSNESGAYPIIKENRAGEH